MVQRNRNGPWMSQENNKISCKLKSRNRFGIGETKSGIGFQPVSHQKTGWKPIPLLPRRGVAGFLVCFGGSRRVFKLLILHHGKRTKFTF